MANLNDSDILLKMMSLPEPLMAEYFARNAHRLVDDATYWNTLGTLWKLGGTVKQQELWLPLFLSDRPRRHKIMNTRERRRWRKLSAEVTAYRAVNTADEAFTAISWTLCKSIAEVFSQKGKRTVVSRTFRKDEIFALFDRRGEEEILVIKTY